ncbi:Ubiquitin carboxyl-terminal hydrolase 38 [Elasticomyces elasticus]|nr:Ubiquitin carboxyl-terminal hydrolase 38 [Elasticomyces elasticus]
MGPVTESPSPEPMDIDDQGKGEEERESNSESGSESETTAERFSSIDFRGEASGRETARLCHELRLVQEDLEIGSAPDGFDDLVVCLLEEDFYDIAKTVIPILRGDADPDLAEQAAAFVGAMKEASSSFIPKDGGGITSDHPRAGVQRLFNTFVAIALESQAGYNKKLHVKVAEALSCLYDVLEYEKVAGLNAAMVPGEKETDEQKAAREKAYIAEVERLKQLRKEVERRRGGRKRQHPRAVDEKATNTGTQTGLSNGKNTCYMNVVLQALRHSRQFLRARYLLQGDDLTEKQMLVRKDILNKIQPLEVPVRADVLAIIGALETNKLPESHKTLKDLWNALDANPKGSILRSFRPGRQHDPNDFLTSGLMPVIGDHVREAFSVTFHVTMCCSRCHAVTERDDEDNVTWTPAVPKEGKHGLVQILYDELFQMNSMEKHCPQCSASPDDSYEHGYTTRLVRPRGKEEDQTMELNIALKLFNSGVGYEVEEKLDTHVVTPLLPFPVPGLDCMMHIDQATIHDGDGAEQGHYYCYGRGAPERAQRGLGQDRLGRTGVDAFFRWTKYEDSNRTPDVPHKTVMDEKPYIFGASQTNTADTAKLCPLISQAAINTIVSKFRSGIVANQKERRDNAEPPWRSQTGSIFVDAVADHVQTLFNGFGRPPTPNAAQPGVATVAAEVGAAFTRLREAYDGWTVENEQWHIRKLCVRWARIALEQNWEPAREKLTAEHDPIKYAELLYITIRDQTDDFVALVDVVAHNHIRIQRVFLEERRWAEWRDAHPREVDPAELDDEFRTNQSLARIAWDDRREKEKEAKRVAAEEERKRQEEVAKKKMALEEARAKAELEKRRAEEGGADGRVRGITDDSKALSRRTQQRAKEAKEAKEKAERQKRADADLAKTREKRAKAAQASGGDSDAAEPAQPAAPTKPAPSTTPAPPTRPAPTKPAPPAKPLKPTALTGQAVPPKSAAAPSKPAAGPPPKPVTAPSNSSAPATPVVAPKAPKPAVPPKPANPSKRTSTRLDNIEMQKQQERDIQKGAKESALDALKARRAEQASRRQALKEEMERKAQDQAAMGRRGDATQRSAFDSQATESPDSQLRRELAAPKTAGLVKQQPLPSQDSLFRMPVKPEPTKTPEASPIVSPDQRPEATPVQPLGSSPAHWPLGGGPTPPNRQMGIYGKYGDVPAPHLWDQEHNRWKDPVPSASPPAPRGSQVELAIRSSPRERGQKRPDDSPHSHVRKVPPPRPSMEEERRAEQPELAQVQPGAAASAGGATLPGSTTTARSRRTRPITYGSRRNPRRGNLPPPPGPSNLDGAGDFGLDGAFDQGVTAGPDRLPTTGLHGETDILAEPPKEKFGKGKRMLNGLRHPKQSIADLRGKAKGMADKLKFGRLAKKDSTAQQPEPAFHSSVRPLSPSTASGSPRESYDAFPIPPPLPPRKPHLSLEQYHDNLDTRRLSRIASEPQLARHERQPAHQERLPTHQEHEPAHHPRQPVHHERQPIRDSAVFGDVHTPPTYTATGRPVIATPTIIPPTPNVRDSLLSHRRPDSQLLGARLLSPRHQRSFTSDPGTPTKGGRAEFNRNLSARPIPLWRQQAMTANSASDDLTSNAGSRAQSKPRSTISWRDFAAAKAASRTNLAQTASQDSSRESVRTAVAEPMYTEVAGRRHRLVMEGQGLYKLELVEDYESMSTSLGREGIDDSENRTANWLFGERSNYRPQ